MTMEVTDLIIGNKKEMTARIEPIQAQATVEGQKFGGVAGITPAEVKLAEPTDGIEGFTTVFDVDNLSLEG